MKITIITHYFLPHVGGIEIVAYNQAKSLVKQGHKVTVLTSRVGDQPSFQKIEGITVKRINAANFFENNFNIPFPIFSVQLLPSLIKEIKKTDICHIHDVFYLSSIGAAIVAKILKKPVVMTQHVGMVHANPFLILIQKIVYHTFGKIVFNTSEKIIAYNPLVASFVASLGVSKNKIVQIRNGVDLSLFSLSNKITKFSLKKKYSLPLDKKIVLFVGRFVEKKGYEKLFNARDNNYLIIFVGSGTVSNKIKINNNVMFVKNVGQKELADYYKLSDLFVSPSSGEIFTLTMQEAMASGLPIITTLEKEYKQYNLDEKYIKFIKTTSINIKKSIKQIFANTQLKKSMSKYSYAYAQKELNWDKNVLQLTNIYKEVTK